MQYFVSEFYSFHSCNATQFQLFYNFIVVLGSYTKYNKVFVVDGTSNNK